MKFVIAILFIVASGVASAQRTKDPGLSYPQHATVPKGHNSSSSGPVAGRPITNSAANDLAKIEQKGIKVRASRATTPHSAAAPVAAAEDRNKPIKFASKPHPDNIINPKTSSSGHKAKLR
jgi:hypothetical protein